MTSFSMKTTFSADNDGLEGKGGGREEQSVNNETILRSLLA
jgi:hypothetical protein